jgi:hypothetical protein
MTNAEYEPTDAELLAMASQFDLYLDDEKEQLVHVMRRRFNGGQDWVAINQGKFLFNHAGTWEYQPVFTDNDDYLYHTGWDDPRKAIAAVRKSGLSEAAEFVPIPPQVTANKVETPADNADEASEKPVDKPE